MEMINSSNFKEVLGRVSKGVERDGKAMYSNSTSSNHAFFSEANEGAVYRQQEVHNEGKNRSSE
jgi:hypothetical protein